MKAVRIQRKAQPGNIGELCGQPRFQGADKGGGVQCFRQCSLQLLLKAAVVLLLTGIPGIQLLQNGVQVLEHGERNTILTYGELNMFHCYIFSFKNSFLPLIRQVLRLFYRGALS